MDQDWILQTKETRRTFSSATWIPLRASCNDERGEVRDIGYVSEFFGCGSVAFPPEHREVAELFGWSDIGIGRSVQPYAYKDGHYSSIDQYQYHDKEPIGVHLVFEHPQPVLGGRLWILNPDLVVALHLIKDGKNWVRPEENFVVVAREVLDEEGHHRLPDNERRVIAEGPTFRFQASAKTSRQERENQEFVHLKASHALALFALLALTPPTTHGQDLCRDVLEKAVPKHVAASTKKRLQTMRYASLRRSDAKDVAGKGAVPEYGGAKFDKHQRSAVNQKAFDWLDDATESSIAISSGDPEMLHAWLTCMQSRNPGLVAWFVAPDNHAFKLNLRYQPRQVNDAAQQVTLTRDVTLPAWVEATDHPECLKKGRVIKLGTCTTTLQGRSLRSPDRQTSRRCFRAQKLSSLLPDHRAHPQGPAPQVHVGSRLQVALPH